VEQGGDRAIETIWSRGVAAAWKRDGQGRDSQVTDCRLQVAGCRLQVPDCRRRVGVEVEGGGPR
jgi:hypothetical protein